MYEAKPLIQRFTFVSENSHRGGYQMISGCCQRKQAVAIRTTESVLKLSRLLKERDFLCVNSF